MPVELHVNDLQKIYRLLPVLSKILKINYFSLLAPFRLKPVSLIVKGMCDFNEFIDFYLFLVKCQKKFIFFPSLAPFRLKPVSLIVKGMCDFNEFY